MSNSTAAQGGFHVNIQSSCESTATALRNERPAAVLTNVNAGAETTEPASSRGSPIDGRPARAGVEWTLSIADGKLKYCGSGLDHVARAAGREWTSDATTLTVLLTAHAAIVRYLLVQIDLARAVAKRQSRNRSHVLERDAQRAVVTAVRFLRGRGVGPEGLLVRFKELLAALPRREYDVWETVRQQTIQWAIEGYYASD